MSRLSKARKRHRRRMMPQVIKQVRADVAYFGPGPIALDYYMRDVNREFEASWPRWDGVRLNARFRRRARQISWPEVLEATGCGDYLKAGRFRSSGTVHVICPFHDERSPSLICYPNGGFECMGCGETGDVAAFVERIMRGRRTIPTSKILHAVLDPLIRVAESQPLSAPSV